MIVFGEYPRDGIRELHGGTLNNRGRNFDALGSLKNDAVLISLFERR